MRQTRLNWAQAHARLERLREAIEHSAAPASEEKEQIFRRRAELLAQPARAPEQAPADEAVVVFRVGAQRYGFALSSVAEVIAGALCAPVPGSPPEVAGVIQVRGEIRPVWDVGRLLGVPEEEKPGGTVLLLREGGREFGARIGGVEDIRMVPPGERRPPPQGAGHASWLTADFVTVLDAGSLFQGGSE